MSYRDPKIIDNKSGLLVPQAMMKGIADIATAFDARFTAQKKANELEAKRLADLGFKLDEQEQDSLEDLGKTKLQGSEAYQKSVRKAQDHFNQMYFDAKRVVYTNRSLTNKQTAELREKMTFAKGQLLKINDHVPQVATLSKKAKELRQDGNTILGFTESYKAIDNYTKEDTVGFGAALDNMKGTSLLMSYDTDGNLFLNGTYQGGSMTQSIESFNNEDFRLTNDISQVATNATAASVKKMMDGNKLNPSFFRTSSVNAQGQVTEVPEVVDERVKILENGVWTGDYQVTSYNKINQQGKSNILQSVQLATADLETLKGQPNYLTTMQNQFDIDEKTAKAWKSGDKKAEAIVNEAVNKQVAGRFGLQAKPILDGNNNVTGYDYIKEGKTSVDKAPNKSMTAQKSQALLNNYLEDFNLAAQNNLGKDELIVNTLQVGNNRRIRLGSGYYTPVGMEINTGLVTITKTGKPDRETQDGKDRDIVNYDLTDPVQLYNFIRATTGMQETEIKALRKKILAYQKSN